MAILIENNHVHVWQISTLQHLGYLDKYYSLLSELEKNNADNFKFNKDQVRYIVAHAMLRLILIKYLGYTHCDFELNYSKFGKPCINSLFNKNGVEFNLSYSHDMVIIAITRGKTVGIDIEKINYDIDENEIINAYFSEKEICRLNAVDNLQRKDLFFRYWTIKEAFIKAKGEGLSYGLNNFTVQVSEMGGYELLEDHFSSSDLDSWNIKKIDTEVEYVASLVVEGSEAKIVNYYH